MLHKIGAMYADVWLSENGYRVSVVPAEKVAAIADSFFGTVGGYDEERDVVAELGPYPDENMALCEAAAWMALDSSRDLIRQAHELLCEAGTKFPIASQAACDRRNRAAALLQRVLDQGEGS